MASRNQKAGLAGAALFAAIGLVSQWEGREQTAILTPDGKRYEAYQDIVGVWTVCDGITRGVKPGAQYTAAQCDQGLSVELQRANTYIDRCITTPISAKERAAYVSAGYNLGPAPFCTDTGLRRKLNAGDRVAACKELPRWNKAGGKVVQGLTNRRNDEMRVCLEGAAQ